MIEHPDGVVLIRRGHPPFQGSFALPGGFVDDDETTEQAARREVKEETGLDVRLVGLIGVYSGPGRDPRGSTLSVVYRGQITAGHLRAGDDASEAAVFPCEALPELAFDHGQILYDAFHGNGRKRLE